MLTLPYLLTTPNRPGLQENAASILEKTEIMASARHAFEDLIGPYVGGEGEETPSTPNMIALLQRQLQNEATGEWQLSFIPRLFDPPQAQDDMDEAEKLQRHPFPPIEIPQAVNPGPRPLFPQVFFSLYADQEIEVRA